jgi:hypothetical protein
MPQLLSETVVPQIRGRPSGEFTGERRRVTARESLVLGPVLHQLEQLVVANCSERLGETRHRCQRARRRYEGRRQQSGCIRHALSLSRFEHMFE